MRNALIPALLLLVLIPSVSFAAPGPPPELVQIADLWIREHQTSKMVTDFMADAHLGEALKWYSASARDVAVASPNANLRETFRWGGWVFLLEDHNGRAGGTLWYSHQAGQWKYLDAVFGPDGETELQDAARRMPEKAKANGLVHGPIEVSIYRFYYNQLVVADDGAQELVLPVGVYTMPWRKGETHSARETMEQFKAMGGSGAGGDIASSGGSGLDCSLWLLLSGAALLGAGGVVIYRRRAASRN